MLMFLGYADGRYWQFQLCGGRRKDFGKQLIAAKKLRPDANLCLPSVISDGKF